MKKDARSLPAKAQEALRIKAVEAVCGGMSQVAAAKAFGVTRQAVGNWMKAYRKDGMNGLAAKAQGRPKTGGRLQGWQAAAIVNLITDRHPEQLKLPFVLWTREAVRTLVRRRFGVRVSLTTVGRYLGRWGFTPQKPVRRAYERNDAAVQRWLEEEYPAIRKQAKREKARIYWADEMGLRSDHQAGRSYAPRGKTPAIAGTGQRFGCNVLSAITNRGHLDFMVFKKRFTASVFIRFLRRLVRQTRRKVFIIVDRHPVHRSQKVRKWLGEHPTQIRLFFLPGYSPELNPDEMVNQDVKTNAVGRKRARNLAQLMGHARRYLEHRRANPDSVKRYFHESSVRYAAT
jgi:transposase